MVPVQMTILHQGGRVLTREESSHGRPRDTLIAEGVREGFARSRVNALLPLFTGEVLASVVGGTKAAPVFATVLLDRQLQRSRVIDGFCGPYTPSEGCIGGCIDPSTGRLGLLELDTFLVTPTDLCVPGGRFGGQVSGARSDSAYIHLGETLSTFEPQHIFTVLPDGMIGWRNGALQRCGEVSWTVSMLNAPSRVAFGEGRVAVLWPDEALVLDAESGETIVSIPGLSSVAAGFYEKPGPLTDIAVGPGGLVVVGSRGIYGCLITLDDRGVYRVSAGTSRKKRVEAIAVMGDHVLTGGNETFLRRIPLLSDEVGTP